MSKQCQNCGQIFETDLLYQRHAATSWCARNLGRGPKVSWERKRHARLVEQGAIDPMRPELGKLKRGTLVGEAISRWAERRRPQCNPSGAAPPQNKR